MMHPFRSKDNIIVIVERDPKCKALPDLKHCRFSIAGDQKIMEVCDAIRKRILKIDQKYQSQSFFLFTNKILPNKCTLLPLFRTIYQGTLQHTQRYRRWPPIPDVLKPRPILIHFEN